MRRGFRELSLAGLLGLLLAGLALFAPSFFQAQPLISLAAREAPALLGACAMAMVIICRQIDISLGAQFSICSVCAGLLTAAHWPLILVLPASVLVGASLGAINGALVAGAGLPSVVVTLATMATYRESLRWLRQGVWVDLPDGTQWFGCTQGAGQALVIGCALLVFALQALALRRLAAGRFLYAVGSDAEAARLAGLRPARTTFAVFVLAGGLAGLGAMLNLAQSPQVDPNSGTGLELKAIAACVVGGVAISGGRGKLQGVLLGLALLACIGPALVHLHVQPYWDKTIQGTVILVAVAAERWQKRGNDKVGDEVGDKVMENLAELR
jgi:rhamnose transport system permease protein